MANYSVVEEGKEIQTVASLYGAAKLWEENRARRVYQSVLSGPPGAGCVAAGPGSDCGRITCRAYRSDPMMPPGFSGEAGYPPGGSFGKQVDHP